MNQPKGQSPQPQAGCRVYFVGAGPGAADLITLRGARILAQAQVVLHDALTDPALKTFAPQADWVFVGKRGFCDSTSQTRINALLVQYARSCQTVVRLKGGDPSIFGRLEEELLALHDAGIASEVVPGVSAALAAAAVTSRPLTRRGRGRSVCLTTAATAPKAAMPEASAPQVLNPELQTRRHADTEVFYMAGKQLAALGRALLKAGWPADTPTSVVSHAATHGQLQSEHPLHQLAQAGLLHAGRPTVVIVGAGASPLHPHTLRAGTAQGLPAPEPAAGGMAASTLTHNPARLMSNS
jgi:uroporphyrin-III C-methyltransferase